jgi:hypothetical protein
MKALRGDARSAPGQREPEARLGIFRRRARPTPDEVSAFVEEHRHRFGVEPISPAAWVGLTLLLGAALFAVGVLLMIG